VPSKGEVQSDLKAIFLGAIRVTLELILEEEIRRLVGAYKWERSGRADVRNGTYLRRLITSLGAVDLEVPRSRENGSAGSVIGRYKRRTEELDDAIVAAYVNGVSTRKMGRITEALMGEDVGRSTVSRVTKTLEEKVEELRRAPISEPMIYLYLDATFLDARWARAVENVSVLVAYGIGPDGKRKLLAITIGAQESEESWAELLRQLIDRGLHGVKLVIADDHAGLRAAVRHALPEARQQRCVVHLTRNVFTKTPQRLRKRVAREVTRVFLAPNIAQARERLEAFKNDFGKQLPEAVECLESGFSAATQFYAFPKAHWRRIKTTNGVERLHAEIKRRTDAIGAFPDRASALRLIIAIALTATKTWADRRYLDMSVFEKNKPKEENETKNKAAA